MKTEKKYLKLYQEWMEAGEMPSTGLCMALNWRDNLELFKPTAKEYGLSEGESTTWKYWAATGEPLTDSLSGFYERKFTPMRQNIILLMAAMAGEL